MLVGQRPHYNDVKPSTYHLLHRVRFPSLAFQGRIIVGNRGARLATFGYVIVMHLLVFLVLYKMVTTTDPVCPSVHDSNDGQPDQ